MLIRSVFILSLLGLLVACNEDSDDQPTPALQVQTQTNLYAPNDVLDRTVFPPVVLEYRPWTYVNLRTGQVLTNADSNSTNWDIALKGTTIRTNSMISGPGSGAGYVAQAPLEQVLTVDTTALAQDSSTASYAIPTGSGNGWYNYNGATNTITPIPGRTVVIRCADGTSYAKLRLISYYKDAPATPTAADSSAFYTFDYVVQTNGSTSF